MENNGKVAGTLIFGGAAQFLIMLIVAESTYPNYSVSRNYISDLGVGSTAGIFNTSIILLGALIAVSSIFLYLHFRGRLLTATVLLAGAGAAGVGVFPESSGAIHGYMALVTFLFSGISAIVSAREIKSIPLRVYSAALGAMTIVCLLLYATGHYYAFGRGGMERLIVYPALVWALGFAGHLLS